jgi:hypothetical protein
MAIVYVNGTTGSDSYDGSSPNVKSNKVGPKKSIKGGLDASSSGGTISIASGTYRGDNNKNLTVKLNLTITGAGKDNTILDAEDDRLFFKIEDKYTVNIQNLAFTNGKASGTVKGQDGDCGGAIYNKGILVVQSCSFTNNRGANGSKGTMTEKAGHGGNGGAIWNVGTLTMNDCELSGNKGGDGGEGFLSKDGHKGGNGGAIMNEGTLTLNNCTLHDNHTGKGGDGGNRNSKPGSAGRGGAIFNTGNVTIFGGEFYGNYSAKGGTTSFERNSNGGDAGAIYNSGTMSIDGQCNIHDNYTGDGRDTGKFLKDAGSGGNGGAIYNDGTLTIEGCTLTKNKTGCGGDGYDDSDSQGFGLGQGGNGGNGGAIYNNSTLTITNCTISYNTAGKAGHGGQSTLDDDAANGGVGGHGGAIYNSTYGVLTIEGTPGSFVTINNNTAGKGGKGGKGRRCYDQYIGSSGNPGNGGAGGCGGAIYNYGTIQSIVYTRIDSNVAGQGGTAGSFKTSDPVTGKVDHGKGGIGGRGGGIYNVGALNRIENSIITNNSAGNGGNGNTCSMNNSGDGASGGDGGGIYSSRSLVINSSTISNNKAGNGGDGGNVKVEGNLPSLDSGNGGKGGQGGGIFLCVVNPNQTTLNAVNCMFESNSAGTGGNGGIDDYSGAKSSDGGKGGSGGGISLVMSNKNTVPPISASISFIQCTISGNNSGNGGKKSKNGTDGSRGQGGGIFALGSSLTQYGCNMYLCRIINNAPQAIYHDLLLLQDPSKIVLQNNWWGSNDDPHSQVAGYVLPQYYTPWLIANLSALPSTISVGQYSKVTVDLLKNSNGEDTHSKYNAYIQNGIPVSFQCDDNYGYIDPASYSIVNGKASVSYHAKVSGTSSVSSTIDSQTLNTSIIIS